MRRLPATLERLRRSGRPGREGRARPRRADLARSGRSRSCEDADYLEQLAARPALRRYRRAAPCDAPSASGASAGQHRSRWSLTPRGRSPPSGTACGRRPQAETTVEARRCNIRRMNSADALANGGLTHLQRLEAESIHIMREVVAEAENPVMLYSIGKDSAVMLHLAMRPSIPPSRRFRCSTWTPPGSSATCTRSATGSRRELGLELLVHVNRRAWPGTSTRSPMAPRSTPIMKTEALKQALDEHGFDVAFGGARRDEERSRAKERVFSFRTASTAGIRRTSVPSCGGCTTRASARESRSACSRSPTGPSSTSGFTSTREIPIVPLYLAAERPVVERDGS